MVFRMNRRKMPEKAAAEYQFNTLKGKRFFSGFLDCRVRYENYNRDFVLNCYDIKQSGMSVSCIYTAESFHLWQKLAKLPLDKNNDGVIVYPALGVFPNNEQNFPNNWEHELKYHLIMNPNVCVGEIGLDLSEKADSIPLDAQKEMFSKQLNLGYMFGRTTLISAKNAAPELMQTLTENREKLPPKMIIAAADVPVKLLPEFQAFPQIYYSFSNTVMDSRGYNDRQVLHKIPMDRILLESKTVSEKCNSSHLPHTANFIAKNLRIDKHKLYEILEQNNQRVLGD